MKTIQEEAKERICSYKKDYSLYEDDGTVLVSCAVKYKTSDMAEYDSYDRAVEHEIELLEPYFPKTHFDWLKEMNEEELITFYCHGIYSCDECYYSKYRTGKEPCGFKAWLNMPLTEKDIKEDLAGE
jgi:hypothetical protein